MKERDIDFVDTVADLRGSVGQPYFPDGDGHPNALGHKIIAQILTEFIKWAESKR